MSKRKKKLSGYNLINKGKPQVVLEKSNREITHFFKALIDSTSKASVKNDDAIDIKFSWSWRNYDFYRADADEVFESRTVQLSKDLCLWSKILSSINIEILIKNGSTYYNNSNCTFSKDKPVRKLSNFAKKCKNQAWLVSVLSIEKFSVLCFVVEYLTLKKWL